MHLKLVHFFCLLVRLPEDEERCGNSLGLVGRLVREELDVASGGLRKKSDILVCLCAGVMGMLSSLSRSGFALKAFLSLQSALTNLSFRLGGLRYATSRRFWCRGKVVWLLPRRSQLLETISLSGSEWGLKVVVRMVFWSSLVLLVEESRSLVLSNLLARRAASSNRSMG